MTHLSGALRDQRTQQCSQEHPCPPYAWPSCLCLQRLHPCLLFLGVSPLVQRTYCMPHLPNKMLWFTDKMWDIQVGTIMLMYIVALAYAASSPIILPFTLAYFIVSWCVQPQAYLHCCNSAFLSMNRHRVAWVHSAQIACGTGALNRIQRA